MPYLSASAVVIHHDEALYQVYAPLPLTFTLVVRTSESLLMDVNITTVLSSSLPKGATEERKMKSRNERQKEIEGG